MLSPKYSYLSANNIRQVFLDYFTKNGHRLIRSSSVKPFGDPSLEFVNAGMNQFKNVFLGAERIPFGRACNSQKCIRVGGKHNDLNAVGFDGYHHTFFEMLGNWSFNDYFKEEACRLAWRLLRSPPFSLHPNRLYVTYFAGSQIYNLQPDLETKEIWLKIGVDEERVVPFGLDDNFWEMGPTGPCGPCTEIHYDHVSDLPRSHLVNTGLSTLTELWNIVFIQYNRLESKELVKLDKHYVDTGMGFERLVALLQNKDSNYDTDLFSSYFSTLSKVTGLREYQGRFGKEDEGGIDTAYRILADHSRMMTIAVADNLLPDHSYGLRRVIRKALATCEGLSQIKSVHLLTELSNIAAESFANIFPEVVNTPNKIKYVLEEEYEMWKETQSRVKGKWVKVLKEYPQLESLTDFQSLGLISSLELVLKCDIKENGFIPRDVALTMYDRHGLSPPLIQHLTSALGYKIDLANLEKDILELKKENKAQLHSKSSDSFDKIIGNLMINDAVCTDNSSKLHCRKSEENDYEFDSIICHVKDIFVNGRLLDESERIEDGMNVMLVLDKTNMWSINEQSTESDSGRLKVKNSPGYFIIDKAVTVQQGVYHYATFHSPVSVSGIELKKVDCELSVDKERRLGLMRNSTAALLLYYAVSSKFLAALSDLDLNSTQFSLTFSVFDHSFTTKDVLDIEKDIEKLCKKGIDIDMSLRSSSELVGLSDIYIPSFVNFSPNRQIHIATLNADTPLRCVVFGPCLLNSRDTEEISILDIDIKKKGREVTLIGATGEQAKTVKENEQRFLALCNSLGESPEESIAEAKQFLEANLLPWQAKEMFHQKMKVHEAAISSKQILNELEILRKKIREAEESGRKYLVAYCGEGTKLEKVIKSDGHIAVLGYATNRGYLTARCSVPKVEEFSAQEWMNAIATQYGGKAIPSKKYAPFVYYLSPLRLPKGSVSSFIETFHAQADTKAQALIQNHVHHKS